MIDEIINPIPNAANKYNVEQSNIIIKDPCIGTLYKNFETIRQRAKPIIATLKYGIILDNNISIGLTGVINNDSKVPFSHSFAITKDVKNTPTIVIIMTISPGIKYQTLELESFLLKNYEFLKQSILGGGSSLQTGFSEEKIREFLPRYYRTISRIEFL